MFFLAPFIINHRGYFDLQYTFLLLPWVVYTNVSLALAIPNAPRRVQVVRLLVCFASSGVLVFLNPYPYAVAILLTACVYAALLVHRARRRAWAGCGWLFAGGAAILLPAALYSAVFSTGAGQAESSLDFYRGQGVDLVSVFVPTNQQFFGKLIWSPVAQWLPSSFFGDGSNVQSNFIGIVTVASVLVGLFLLIREGGGRRALRIGLVCGGIACVLLALGPSIKVDDRRPVVPGPLSHASYFQTEEQATVTVPWDNVYKLPVVKNMRGTYRWQLGARLVGAVGVAAVAAWLLERRRYAIVTVVLGLIAVETLGTTVVHGGSGAQRNADAIRGFRREVVQPVARVTKEGERVLFLPAGNDFTIPSLAAPIGVVTYNANFDKELARCVPRNRRRSSRRCGTTRWERCRPIRSTSCSSATSSTPSSCSTSTSSPTP